MGNICDTVSNNDQQLSFARFQQINKYEFLSQSTDPQIKKELDPQNRTQDTINPLFSLIKNSYRQKFQDKNFSQLDTETPRTIALSELYDYQRNKIDYVYTAYETRMDSFEQKNLEFTYLTSIFYEVCRNKQLREQIFITKKVNHHSTFLLSFYCNGKSTLVAIDDKIPTDGENPKYLSVTRGNQLWPYIMEKAWCKQIGSYDKARGLSPEDVFEEITGAPAYSYFLKLMEVGRIQKEMNEALENKYWICLTATENHKLVKNRQVFYVENKSQREYRLRSAYLNHSLKDHKKNENRPIEMTISEIVETFDYMTIGFYRKSAKVTTIPYSSHKREQKVYEVRVDRKDVVNIRFIQFYKEYLTFHQQSAYDYSPVFLQLYNGKFDLLYEGCSKSTSGNKSAHISSSCLVNLEPGLYYLRIQVDWIFEDLIREGQIVLYSENTQMKQIDFENDLIDKMNRRVLDSPLVNEIVDNEQQIVVRSVEKENGYIIEIRNCDDKEVKLEVNLQQSKNIRLRRRELEKGILRLSLDAKESTRIEVLAEKTDIPCELASFEIVKL